MIIKCIAGEFWSTKFAHEIQLYQVFSAHPPPVRVPKLVHTDSRTIVEHLSRLGGRH